MNSFSFDQFLKQFEQKGKDLYGDHFRVHESDREIIQQLVIYFAKDEEMALQYGISFRKGILLNGPVGCGKTTIMSLFRWFLPKEQRYVVKSCQDVSSQFIEQGHSIIRKYGRISFEQEYQNNYCFDDLGTEDTIKHYGNECNVMEKIISLRYDSFISYNILTHVTTNLTSSEIEEYYGTRIRSRMREMFNLISFDKTTPDKRA
jgi:predicted ATPase